MNDVRVDAGIFGDRYQVLNMVFFQELGILKLPDKAQACVFVPELVLFSASNSWIFMVVSSL